MGWLLVDDFFVVVTINSQCNIVVQGNYFTMSPKQSANLSSLSFIVYSSMSSANPIKYSTYPLRCGLLLDHFYFIHVLGNITGTGERPNRPSWPLVLLLWHAGTLSGLWFLPVNLFTDISHLRDVLHWFVLLYPSQEVVLEPLDMRQHVSHAVGADKFFVLFLAVQ